VNTPQTINQLFAAVESPPEAELDAFVAFCIGRMEHLIETEEARLAFQQLKETGTVSSELAEKANVESNSLTLQHFSAAKAVARAVCHCTKPESHFFNAKRAESARLVALYCQWALSRSEYPPDPDDMTYCDDDETEDDGRTWLVRQLEDNEQAAQLAFIFDRFPHWHAEHP